MAVETYGRVAILYPGDLEARRNPRPESTRFADLFAAFAAQGLNVEPAVYHDDFSEEVREQLLRVDGVLVWTNPLEGGRDRSVLDSMLRDVTAQGVFVSAHPDMILKLGTKEVLYRTRGVGWGCDTHLYRSPEQLRDELPHRLAGGGARVLKQNRGNGGIGVWKVELSMSSTNDEESRGASGARPDATVLRVRHARRGCVEEQVPLDEFVERCGEYFAAGGLMLDQEYQERLPEGTIRCYLTHGTVNGFGHQAINALFPAPPGAGPADAPEPGPRLYHPPTKPEFQALKRQLEEDWVPAVQRLLSIESGSLPILWDCDFLLGPKNARGEDTYVLCEINVSSVAPYPASAAPYIVAATASRLEVARRSRPARKGGDGR